MEKEKKKSKWLFFAIGVPIIMIAALGLFLWGALGTQAQTVLGHISLNQRDIAINVGETVELEFAETESGISLAKEKVKWISNNPSVASVDEDGVVTGSKGGEARITAVVKDAGKEYTASCIVTVKTSGLEYSIYQIQWYTQRKNRNGYEVSVETYERLVGSEVNLTKQEATEKLPKNYVLNEKKSVLDGTVKHDKAGCILQVYYDVAEISYAVDYYYESDTTPGTYQLKETKQFKAYAFSKVEAPMKVAGGFVVNKTVKGSVLTVDSVTSSTRLKVYCDRFGSGSGSTGNGDKFLVADKTSGMTADSTAGTVTAKGPGASARETLYFAANGETNTSSYWSVTGTVEQDGDGLKEFVIQSADGTKTEYYIIYDENLLVGKDTLAWYPWYNYPEFVFNGNTGLSTTHGSMQFKAVIEDDQFTVWLKDGKIWSVPLTDSRFGGFEAGTSYRLGLGVFNGDAQVKWSDLKVRSGYNEFLVADQTSGVTADLIGKTVIANGSGPGTRENLYFATNDGDSSNIWDISGTLEQDGEALKEFVIQSADGTKTEYYIIYDEHLLTWVNNSFVWYAWYNYPEFVFNGLTGLSISHGQMQFRAVIEYDQFTVWLGSGRIWSVPLTDPKFGGFEAGTSYRIGVGVFNGYGQVTWSNLEVAYKR